MEPDLQLLHLRIQHTRAQDARHRDGPAPRTAARRPSARAATAPRPDPERAASCFPGHPSRGVRAGCWWPTINATRPKSLAAVRIMGAMWQCEGARYQFGSLSGASLTILGRRLRRVAYSAANTPAYGEAWVTMDGDIDELPALEPSRAEGRQASKTQHFVVVREKTKLGESGNGLKRFATCRIRRSSTTFTY